jgi:hypothetical protein
MKKKWLLILITLFYSLFAGEQIARLHYNGGGDWYNDPDAIPNFCNFLNNNLSANLLLQEAVVTPSSSDIFQYPFIFVTGHGDIKFNEKERKNILDYLSRGGFIYVDDDYGLDKSFRLEMKQLFPDKGLVEIPKSHEIFSAFYKFPEGTPKIHKHDDKRPQSLGIFDNNGRLMLLYTYESNISDGWSNAHDDSPEIRQKAFEFGANIYYYQFIK